jgi:hypothetical protein
MPGQPKTQIQFASILLLVLTRWRRVKQGFPVDFSMVDGSRNVNTIVLIVKPKVATSMIEFHVSERELPRGEAQCQTLFKMRPARGSRLWNSQRWFPGRLQDRCWRILAQR